MSMLTVVAITSLALAVISFLIFGYQLYLRRTQVTHQLKTAEDSLDLAKLVEAFAKLADSMEKMGPLAMSLFASMFFMVVALLAAGFGK
jgi:ammonia channel protein AmtB